MSYDASTGYQRGEMIETSIVKVSKRALFYGKETKISEQNDHLIQLHKTLAEQLTLAKSI